MNILAGRNSEFLHKVQFSPTRDGSGSLINDGAKQPTRSVIKHPYSIGGNPAVHQNGSSRHDVIFMTIIGGPHSGRSSVGKPRSRHRPDCYAESKSKYYPAATRDLHATASPRPETEFVKADKG